MNDEFIEVKTTDGQQVFIRKDAVGAVEVVPGSQRVEGHIKVYTPGFKFLIAMEKDAFLRSLGSKGPK